jgi:hypothetical protein
MNRFTRAAAALTCFSLALALPQSALAGNIAFGSTEALAGAHAGQIAGETISVGNGTTIFMDMNGNSSGNPVLVIFAIPNNSAVPIITSAVMYDTGSNPSTLTGVSTDTVNFTSTGTNGVSTRMGGANGFVGTLGSGGVLDSFLGVSGDSSESFMNWQGYDENHLTPGFASGQPANFGIYVWELTGMDGATSDPYSSMEDAVIKFTTNGLPLGSFVIGADSDGTFTPFTVAGFVTTTSTVTPEPASLVLFGSGLVAIAGLLRRKKK